MEHEHELARHALAHGKKHEMPKALREFHVKELNDGTYHHIKHHGDGKPPTEGSSTELDGAHDAMEEHMGQPNDGEEAAEEQIHPGIHEQVAQAQGE